MEIHKMNPIIITAMHGRPDITRVFGMASQRIFKETGVRSLSVVTRNDYDNIRLCNEYGINWVESRNEPLGAKWNTTLQHLKDIDFSHVIILGSDDIVSTSFIEYQISKSDTDLSGMEDLWFWGLNPKRAGFRTFGHWTSNLNKLLGVGRMVSRKMLEKLDWKLWDDDLRSGLDRSALDRVRGVTKNINYFNLKKEGLFAMDIKYGRNISSLSPSLPNTEFEDPMEVLMKHLPADEVEYLNYLQSQV